MSDRRRFPPALVEQAIPPAVIALALAAAAIFGIGVSVAGARDARAFERRSVITTGVVLADGPGIGATDGSSGDDFHVPVRYDVDGTATVARAPVTDREPYAPGESLPVRYDPRDAHRVEFVDQPYDLATPLAFSIGLGVIALAVGLSALWRPWRLLQLARTGSPTYAFRGRVAFQDRRYLRDRQWVLLDALDTPAGTAPIAVVPLLRSQALPTDGPFDALVKGTVRDGGRAVVLAGDQVLWPSGRVRIGAIPGLGDGTGAG